MPRRPYGPQSRKYLVPEPLPGFPSGLPSQLVKSLPAVQETRVQSLGGEDALEKAMAAHSSSCPGTRPFARSLPFLALVVVHL